MKDNKGFTLVELLAIVVILVVIMLIAAPSMTKQIQKSEEEKQSALNQKIENAAHIYAAKYYADKLVNSESFSFTLQNLVDDGLIDLKGKCEDKHESSINISFSNNVVTYSYADVKGTDCYKQ